MSHERMLQDGSTQILCLTATSGVPLFTRGASRQQLPFSVIGSLNGVHMFADGQGVALSGCQTECGGRVVWRVFHDSVMLIAVHGGGGGQQGSGGVHGEQLFLERLLENVWNCMVLVLGRDELTNARNVERLKKDLRSCFGLVDQLLEDRHQGIMGNLTHCADCLLPPNPLLVQEAVNGFARAADSEFGCLLVHGRVAAATEKWWRLAPQEVVLLSALTRSLAASGSASSDCPVFLPQGSPTVAHRLLRFQLLPGADVCVLCGPTPSLHKAQSDLVRQFWSPLAQTLRDCLAVSGERCLPATVPLPPDTLALLAVNREARRSVSCVRAGTATGDSPTPPSTARCWELLRLFYVFAATRYFSQEEAPAPGAPAEDEDEARGTPTSGDLAAGFSHQPLQCYLVTEECKCYGLQTQQHQLFLLTPLSVPTSSLRNVATQTLSAVTADTGF